MKKLLLLLIVFSCSVYAHGQSSVLPFSPAYKSKKTVELTPNLIFALGYVPKSEINAIRGRASIDNILFKRIGAYTAFEKGLDSDYYKNTIGGTITVLSFLSIWGGLDVISMLGQTDWEFIRKEIGVGISPIPNLVAHIGYSVSVGPTFAFGYNIPLNSK